MPENYRTQPQLVRRVRICNTSHHETKLFVNTVACNT